MGSSCELKMGGVSLRRCDFERGKLVQLLRHKKVGDYDSFMAENPISFTGVKKTLPYL